DLIISNPPFFDNHSKASITLRQIARHTDQLPYSALIEITDRLLKQDGLFYLLIPVHAVERIMEEASKAGLFLIKRIDYRGYSRNQAKVSTLLFSRKADVLEENVLTIYRSEQVYSEESEQYLKPFLLRFSDLTLQIQKRPY
ncbi:MAG: ribose-phosphate pyrophosphokinase, partial [Aestuariibacter sp.]|nr:ribose-phosphate pyrophosphokinase [Aestuariibacter sp.]